jgi:hypothetical protein
MLPILAFAVAACGTGAATSPASPVTPVPPASEAAAGTPGTATASPAASQGPVAIAPGTYMTAAVPVADVRAAIESDDKLTADEKTTIIDSMFGLDGHKTVVYSLTLQAGSWTESESYDGGAFRVGSRATYAFPDDHTVVISEVCCGLTTFAVTPDGAGFKLARVSGTQNTEVDKITGAIIFESRPFQPTP